MKIKFVIFILLMTVMALNTQRFWNPNYGQDYGVVHTPYHGLTLIAHAGGGLQQGRYSNSEQAILQSTSHGFTYIELDFSNTVNGDLVLLHDWEKRYRHYFGLKRPVLSAADYTSLEMKHGLTPIALQDLENHLMNFPKIRIVTDIKYNNVENLRKIAVFYPNIKSRFIPQIYDLKNFDLVQEMGFEDIIYTNYRAEISIDEMIAFAKTRPLFALTIPYETATPNILSRCADINLPVFVHRNKGSTPLRDLNSVSGADAIKARGIAGIYTDYLYPALE